LVKAYVNRIAFTLEENSLKMEAPTTAGTRKNKILLKNRVKENIFQGEFAMVSRFADPAPNAPADPDIDPIARRKTAPA